MPESEFGWGDSDPTGEHPFGSVGMAALVVASGFYCAAIWVAGGLQPLPYLASRARKARRDACQGAPRHR